MWYRIAAFVWMSLSRDIRMLADWNWRLAPLLSLGRVFLAIIV